MQRTADKERRVALKVYGIVFAAVFLAVLPVSPYPPAYGPFEEEGNEPVLFPAKECEVEKEYKEEDGTFIKIFIAPGEQTKVKLEASEQGVKLSVLREEKVVAGPHKVSNVAYDDWLHYYTARTGDFNGDGKPDFMIGIWRRITLGLRIGSYEMVAILSEGDGYKMTSFYDINPTEVRLIDIKGDGRCQYLQSTLIYAVHEKSQLDGEGRNVFVYNLLEIDGAEIRITDRLVDRFPRWVRIGEDKFGEHLTEEQKERLWEGDLLGRKPVVLKEKQEK